MFKGQVLAVSVLAAPLLCPPAVAGVVVEITVLGTVGSNQISGAPLSGVSPGDPMLMRFEVDSGVFANGASLTTRGYAINPGTFSLDFPGIAVGVQTPLPAGQVAYFVLRDESLGTDGFFVSTSVDSEDGLPLSQTGTSGPLVNRHSLDFGASTLGSLDILDGLGTYWAVGLQSVAWSIHDGATSVMDIDYRALRMEVLPAETYCTAGTSASGCQAAISSSGKASAFQNVGFTLYGSGAEGGRKGLFIFGANGRQANPWGNGTSYRCVVPPVTRGTLLAGSGAKGACNGTFAEDLNALWCPGCTSPSANPGAGAVVQSQLWYRDPLNTSNQTTSLSNALEFVVGF